MKKISVFLLGFITGVILFMPKENLYYTFLNFLSKNKIYINSGVNSTIALNLKNGTVYYKGMDIVKFREIKIIPFIFYNEADAKNIVLNFGNYRLFSVKILYHILNPLKVLIKGEGNFGKIEGKIDLLKRNVKIYVYNLDNVSLKKFLRKDSKGYFYYATF